MASSSVITESILSVAAIVSIAIVLAAFIPGLYYIESAQRSYVAQLKTELETDVKIIFASGAEGSTEVKIWVKNTGYTAISSTLIGSGSDLFFGPKGAFQHIPFNNTSPPTWSYVIVNDLDDDGEWDPQETIQIQVSLTSGLSAGDYYVRFSVYTGSYDEYWFSI